MRLHDIPTLPGYTRRAPPPKALPFPAVRSLDLRGCSMHEALAAAGVGGFGRIVVVYVDGAAPAVAERADLIAWATWRGADHLARVLAAPPRGDDWVVTLRLPKNLNPTSALPGQHRLCPPRRASRSR